MLISKIMDVEIYFFARTKSNFFPQNVFKETIESNRTKMITQVDPELPWIEINNKFGDELNTVNTRITKRFKTEPIFKRSMK